MVEHHRRRRERSWRRGMAINAAGVATTTFFVLVVIAATKFTEGAWIPVVLVPLMLAGFLAVRSHHDTLASALARRRAPIRTRSRRGGSRGEGRQSSARRCRVRPFALRRFGGRPSRSRRHRRGRGGRGMATARRRGPLVVVPSPYRELIGPVERWLGEQHRRRPDRCGRSSSASWSSEGGPTNCCNPAAATCVSTS